MCKQHWLALGLLASLTAGCGSEQPALETDAGGNPGQDASPVASRFLPMVTGASWTYRLVDVNTGASGDRVTTVGALEDVGPTHPGKRAFLVRIEKLDGWSMYWQGYEGDVTVRYKSDDHDLTGALVDAQSNRPFRLKLDESTPHMTPGTEYVETFDETTTDASGTVTKQKLENWSVIAVNETVTVPAGTFQNCLHVRRVNPAGGTDKTKDYWYARGVGKIKEIGDNQTEELVSFVMPPL